MNRLQVHVYLDAFCPGTLRRRALTRLTATPHLILRFYLGNRAWPVGSKNAYSTKTLQYSPSRLSACFTQRSCVRTWYIVTFETASKTSLNTEHCTMTKYYYGRANWPKRCSTCTSNPTNYPDDWPPMTKEQIKSVKTAVANKAKAMQCEDWVYKGGKCERCRLKQQARNQNRSGSLKERYDNGEKICPNCGKDNPTYPVGGKKRVSGDYPYCSICIDRARNNNKKTKKARREEEKQHIDLTTQQFCRSCNSAKNKSAFERYYKRKHGRRVVVKGASGFKTCRPCSLRNNAKPCNFRIYFETKAKMADEKLQSLDEAKERYRTKGCCDGCTVDLDAWNTYCESRPLNKGSGPPETLPKRKKSLAADWDHLDPGSKWRNVSEIKNDRRRHKEINGYRGNPGCRIRTISCHKEKTWKSFEVIGGRASETSVTAKTRRQIKLVSTLKWQKWQAQGGKCGNPTCPMTNCLQASLDKIQDTKDTYHTSLTAEELFMMFHAEFEHTCAPEKEANLSSVGRRVTNWDDDKIRDEVDKCTVHCVFCARLKTMEERDNIGKQSMDPDELSLLDFDEITWDADIDEEELFFLLL